MRILYSASNRIGSNVQLQRFLTNLSEKHTVRISAYMKSSSSLKHIDWTLDSLHYKQIPKKRSREIQDIFGHKGVPLVNKENLNIFLSEVDVFDPDIIISDGESLSAHIAKALGIRLWYCSPLHMIDGIDWDKGQLRYQSLLENTRKFLYKLPEAEKILVYSPFGDASFRPILKTGYEWVVPYHIETDNVKEIKNKSLFVINDFERFPQLTKIINALDGQKSLISPFHESFTNIDHYLINDDLKYRSLVKGCERFFSTGETSYIADAFYQEKPICTMPSLKDPESLVNSILIKELDIGLDLAQLELMNMFAVDELEESKNFILNKKYLSKQKNKQLHEKIEEICNI